MVIPAIKADLQVQHEYSVRNSPFLLENESGYAHWRKTKLERYGQFKPDKIIRISDHASLSPETLGEFAVQMQTFNFAFFETDAAGDSFSTQDFLMLGRRFGLNRVDTNSGADSNGVTRLSVVDATDNRARYIPYTSRALNWHTDGYYNPLTSRIDAFTLYCVNQAGQGGDNFMLDHEMVYMQVRDTDPDLLVALMDPEAMIVPANISNKKLLRQAESGPVFMIDSETGRLNMRFSSRPQNIGWKTDALSKRAVGLVREITMDSEYVVNLKLQNRQGIVCNNVLHGRSAFVEDPASGSSRLYYRARYYDAVTFADE